MPLAPIALFAYNRPRHTLLTLQHLRRNALAAESRLFLFSDGPRADATPAERDAVREVRAVLDSEQWCSRVDIQHQPYNRGLAESILTEVTRLVEEFGRLIVLEDDLQCAPGFLQYCNDALDLYESDDRVMHIGG